MKIRLGRLLIAWKCCPSKPTPVPTPTPTPTPTPVPPPPPPVQGQHLTLTVQSSNVSQSDIDAYLTQQNTQLLNEFMPAWGIAAYIDTQPGGWPVYLLDNSDVAGALGYHDYANGSPFANVFVQTAQQAGVSWQSVASHEVLEMLADPGPAFKTATAPNGDVWDYEICDPVEGDLDGSMSDFVFPNFFTVSNGPWDQDKVLSGPFTIAPGGYAVVNGQTVLGQTAPGYKYVDRTYRKRGGKPAGWPL